MFSSWLCVDLVMQNTFKVECWQKKARGHISMDVPYFQSVLHAKICAKYQMWAFFGSGRLRTWFQSVFARTHGKIWADAGPLKVKYLVNAVNFIRKLRGNGLIFLKFCWVPSDPWRESFLMMYSSLCLSFHETVPLRCARTCCKWEQECSLWPIKKKRGGDTRDFWTGRKLHHCAEHVLLCSEKSGMREFCQVHSDLLKWLEHVKKFVF